MKARVKNTGEIIEVERLTNTTYGRLDVAQIYRKDMLDFKLSEPEDEVVIEGRAERTIDGKLRLFTDYASYVYLPADCKIEGEVTITIKPKKK